MLKINSPLSLRPVNTDEFLVPIGRWLTIGGLILIGSVATAITLATFLKFNIAVKAKAIVRPIGELRVVHSEIAGTIKSIDVEINQAVRQGQAIAYLDDSRLATQKRQLEDNIQQSQQQIGQVDAQIQRLEAQIAAQKQSLEREISVAQLEFGRSQRDYQEQKTTAQANLAEAEANLKLARSERQRYQTLADTGAISQLQLEEKQAALHSAEAQMVRVQAALNPSAAIIAIAQERIRQQQAQRGAVLASLEQEREALRQRRTEIQAQILRDRKELQQSAQEIQRSVIRATSDGIILRLNLRNQTQVVRSGDTIAEIAPSHHALVIKAAVATQDIDKVKLGQLAQLRIDACAYPDYGTLKGTVSAISPDALISDIPASSTPPTTQIESSGRYFEVTIQPAAPKLTNGTRQCQLQPGMEAEANIISQEESFLKFLLIKARLLTNL